MSERTCDGRCCAVFSLDDTLHERHAQGRVRDGAFIVDMLIPLTQEGARERALRFGASLDQIPAPGSGRSPYTCRHWDEETRLCTVYEQRPELCRDYPYDGPCGHGCDYCAPEEIQKLYAELRVKNAVATTSEESA